MKKRDKNIKERMIAAGLTMWRTNPFGPTARGIAKIVGVTHSAVLYHFGTSEAMIDTIAEHAMQQRDSIIVPLLIVNKHYVTDGMPAHERYAFLGFRMTDGSASVS